MLQRARRHCRLPEPLPLLLTVVFFDSPDEGDYFTWRPKVALLPSRARHEHRIGQGN